MKKYVLYDNIIQKNRTISFVTATKELLSFFNKDISILENTTEDKGCDKLVLNLDNFHYNNAKILAMANLKESNILCVEDSSFLSLSLTKMKLEHNLEFKNEINSKLKKENLELNLDISILPLVKYIKDEIGFDKIFKTVKYDFTKFKTALYLGSFWCDLEQFTDLSLYENLLKLTGAELIKYSMKENSCGYEILNIKSNLAYKMAGTIMLDMFDNACDFVVVNDARSFIIFDNYQKELERSVNREIGLSVFNLPQIILLACGITDKNRLGLDKHKIKTEII